MLAEIIAIGDEILIGHTLDTNSSWLAGQVDRLGFQLRKINVIRDDSEQINSVLDEAVTESDLVIVTGGLGPTNDDLTMRTLADYFDSETAFSQEVLEEIKAYLSSKNLELNTKNRLQAEVPVKSRHLTNRQGTAPGMWFEEKGTVLVSMPGVPHEMKAMFEEEAMPRIKQHFDLPNIVHRMVMTQGIAEARLAEELEEWEEQLPSEIKLAYLPSPEKVKLRLSVSSGKKSREQLHAIIQEQVDSLKNIIPEHIYAYEDKELEKVVGELLKARNKTLSTAESCTGGYLAHRITSVPGSSAYYQGSVISYSNEVKVTQLGVEADVLKTKGAVSREVVEQMAGGVLSSLGTDYSIAVSGIAGPEGGTEEKPVGTVWIAVASAQEVKSQRFQFGTGREQNIRQTALQSLSMLRKEFLV